MVTASLPTQVTQRQAVTASLPRGEVRGRADSRSLYDSATGGDSAAAPVAIGLAGRRRGGDKKTHVNTHLATLKLNHNYV